MTTRTDIHRPSAIVTEDYQFVALGYQKCEGIEDAYSIQQNRAILDAHRKATGATWSQHEHGGNCHVCGAHCLYTAIFHHMPTNTYIRTGMDCAEKLDMCDTSGFRAFREGVKSALECKAGKAKAQAILADAGLSKAWELAQLEDDPTDEQPWKCKKCDGVHYCENCGGSGYVGNSFTVLRDIVQSVVKYGGLSEAQEKLLGKLVDTVSRWDEIKAEREAKKAAERAAAQDCPSGRVVVTGEVLSRKTQESAYGTQFKMLVRDDRGFKVWGSIPSALQLFDVVCNDEETGETWTEQHSLRKGDRVTFTATLEPSKDDDKFGFYKRPTKAEVLR